MSELNTSVQKLTNKIELAVNNAKSSSEVLEVLQNSLESYIQVTSNFFVIHMNDIRKIYDSIKFKRFPYNRVSSYDVNYTMFSYEDYIDGLFEFVTKVISLRNDDDVDITNVTNTINAVKEKDVEFVKSMHGGENSPIVKMDFDTAMKNVEAIARLEAGISNITAKCYELGKMVIGESKYSDASLEATKVLASSICKHYSYAINEIASTYDNIIDSMKHRTPVAGEKVVEKYQLF